MRPGFGMVHLAMLLLPLGAGAQAAAASAAHAKGAAGPAGASTALRMCAVTDLSLGTDDEHGSFNGMSHAGTLLVLRNLSPTACRVPQRPKIAFLDKENKPLSVKLEVAGANFMHPGPVLVPVVVPPEAEVTAKLRWVSGEVFETGVCVDAAVLTVTLNAGTQQTPLVAHLCGDKAKGVTYQATPLTVDPHYQP